MIAAFYRGKTDLRLVLPNTLEDVSSRLIRADRFGGHAGDGRPVVVVSEVRCRGEDTWRVPTRRSSRRPGSTEDGPAAVRIIVTRLEARLDDLEPA